MGGFVGTPRSSSARVVNMGWGGRRGESGRESRVENGLGEWDCCWNSSKREELKLGRAQFRQCHEMEVLTRASQFVGLTLMHFLCIHWSQVSHCTWGWLILQGREHTPQGF